MIVPSLSVALALFPSARAGAPVAGGAVAGSAIALVMSEAAKVGTQDVPTCVVTVTDAVNRTVTMDFSACSETLDVSGTLVIEVPSGRQVVVTFGDDFEMSGFGIVGTFAAATTGRHSYRVVTFDAGGAPTALVVSDLETGDSSVLDLLDLSLRANGGAAQMIGHGRLVHTGLDEMSGTLDIGDGGADPLTWTLPLTGFTPQSGLVTLATAVAVAFEVEVDPDAYTPVDNGVDDFPAVFVPAEAEVSGVFWASFGPTCEETEIGFTAESAAVVSVTVPVGAQEVTVDVEVPAQQIEATVAAALELLTFCR